MTGTLLSRLMLASVAVAALVNTFGVPPASASPAAPAWRQEKPYTTRDGVVLVGDTRLTVEVSDTEPLRNRGLGYRDGLEPGTGMLFVYDTDPARTRTFWMKGMRFCLDIIWISDGIVQGAAESVCPMDGVKDRDLPVYQSPVPVNLVLEVPAGWMAEHGVTAGTPVEVILPPDPS